jgi:uncharacterized membrane protein YfcA
MIWGMLGFWRSSPQIGLAKSLTILASLIRRVLKLRKPFCMNHLMLLSGGGFVGGAMNALAGGGTFASLPVLIAVGVPSVQANASSTVALYPGGLASVWAYRRGLGPVGMVRLRHLLPITLIGGACGALLLLATPKSAFDHALPWLLLIAMLALAFGNRIGEVLRRYFKIQPAAVLAIQFMLGVYGGYFGGGVGLMMLAVWGLLENRDLKSLNASRTLLVVAANTMAVLIFIAARAVFWRETSVMLLASTMGGYCGAQLGRRCPPFVLRAITLTVTASITIAFFVRAYGP